jgi:cyclophilin family peptidyl-prolyl cis-trans isomerase
VIGVRFIPFVIALPTLTLLSLSPAGTSAEESRSPGRLDVRILSARPVYTPGEPVSVELQFRNPSSSRVTLGEECLRPSSFDVRRAGTQDSFRVRKNRGSAPIEIAPGRTEVSSFDLRLHFKELRERGHYWLSWSCGDHKAALLHLFMAEPFDPGTDKVAAIQTAFGRIEMVLMPGQAPLHVETFVELARSGYYDGIAFQKLVPGLQVESGDRSESASSAWDHQLPPEIDHSIRPGKGLVGAVRRESALTSATRFFILLDAAPSFRGLHTFFAYVRSGGDVLERIKAQEVLSDGGGGAFRLRDPIPIEKIEILPE